MLRSGDSDKSYRVSERSKWTSDRIEVIGDIISAVHSAIDLRHVFCKVACGIRKLVDFDRATISLIEVGEERVRVFALATTKATELKVGDTSDMRGTVTNWLIANRSPLILRENKKDQRFLNSNLFLREGLKSAMVIPLFSGDDVLGSLNLSSRKTNNYSDKDLEVLKPVAEQIAIAIQKWRFYEELEKKTKETAAAYEQLKVTQENLVRSEKLRALGEMASGVAHDVNNHLAAIMLNIHLLSKQARSRAAQETVETIKQATMDCANTVRRIQEFAGLCSRKAFTQVDINQVIEDVITVTKPKWRDEAQHEGKSIRLIKHLGDIMTITGSPEDLRQALVNIVINAVDAMSDSGKITLSTKMEADWVYVSVQDTGIGMTQEVRQRVFDPFFTTKGGGGSGLGLSIALGIVMRHGGDILIDSKEGLGTTITIKLPIKAGVPDEQPSTVGETKQANILIVEDEAPIRGALSQILTEEGHRVTVTHDGSEGVARYKQDKYDLVITDLGMPELSGWGVVKAIKSVDSHSVVVMMTGWGEQLDQTKMKENGVDLVLAKPFDIDRLKSLIEEGLELKCQRLT